MLQHQIVQSPARLGLTNPNSPSLQNPTPPKFPSSSSSHHQQPQSNPPNSTITTGTTATSSALLSLLPPLRRAQSLLLQMASLASKLFEVSSNRPLWLSSFRGSLPTFLSSQAQSMAPPPLESNPSSTKEILSLFTSLQTQLFEAVAELQEILDLQDAKQRLARDIKAKDSALLNFANKLKEAERVLDILVDDYSDYRRPKKVKLKAHEENEDLDNDDDDDVSNTTVASQLNLSDILSYAHRISYTTFAPPEFGSGQAPLRGAFPPAPQDEQMRASQLYAFADLDVGLPKRDETKEKTIEPIIEPPPLETPSLPPVLLPSTIKMPVGWRPGDDVELPKDLSLPQLERKLEGPFPPMDSFPVPRIGEQPLQVGPSMHKPPETIQVRHVQLDIPDQDDDSSDYSTDEGSSDDED